MGREVSACKARQRSEQAADWGACCRCESRLQLSQQNELRVSRQCIRLTTRPPESAAQSGTRRGGPP